MHLFLTFDIIWIFLLDHIWHFTIYQHFYLLFILSCFLEICLLWLLKFLRLIAERLIFILSLLIMNDFKTVALSLRPAGPCPLKFPKSGLTFVMF